MVQVKRKFVKIGANALYPVQKSVNVSPLRRYPLPVKVPKFSSEQQLVGFVQRKIAQIREKRPVTPQDIQNIYSFVDAVKLSPQAKNAALDLLYFVSQPRK